jgi:sodium bicarbonate transporter 10
LSDFKDGLAVQCIASYIFIYFACLTPIITFGGLLGDATDNRIAAIESLVSGFVVGVTYGFFSGQPLTILGSTGPILVFETIVYDTCHKLEWDYLGFRLCIGIWVGVIMLVLVATDASAFVCYITRFTEENFACLIAFIFIKKAVEKLIHISDDYPVHEGPCICIPKNATERELYPEYINLTDFSSAVNESKPRKWACSFTVDDRDDVVKGWMAPECHYVPNAFMMSALLFIGTFLISYHLKNFKSASFFPAKVRGFISDFAVIIAILSMTAVNAWADVGTPTLLVPEKIRPTWEGRGWLIHPLGRIDPKTGHHMNPIWTPIVAIVPALLGSILIFMDQQITAVIVNRKEHKLTVSISKFKYQKTYSYTCTILVLNVHPQPAERRRLPLGLVGGHRVDRLLLHIRSPLVRGRHCALH